MTLTTAPARLVLTICLGFLACSCTYLKYSFVQAEYSRIQDAEPGQLNVKHMIDRENFFIHGRGIDDAGRYAGMPKAIAAFSSKYQTNELVDTMFFELAGSHFGLDLPEGRYDLLVFADINGNGILESAEAVGRRSLELDTSRAPQKVLGQVDLELTDPVNIEWQVAIDLPDSRGRQESLFFPSGTIRKLSDPIFDSSFATLGMYDPASFLEQAPTMFYALEEDLPYKIPVVFVHGINGSARDFEHFIDTLDRSRYKPWFFHYPSGADLDQLAELFYQIFLSGKLYRGTDMPIIVIAHSMGGLIVREAINRYTGGSQENRIRLFVSLASPFGGHAAAASGEKHGLIVLPSWRNLNPENAFISNLYRKPLPDFVYHELIYAFRNPDALKFGENSDGVVALTSQLYPPAQQQANAQFGFDNTHTDIVESDSVSEHIQTLMLTVENVFPQDHLRLFQQGGYPVTLGENYSATAQYAIHAYGKYLMALSQGRLAPFHPEEERFIAVVKGERAPKDEAERDWLRFLREYPQFKDD